MAVTNLRKNTDHWADRVDLAAAFRWTARLNMQEAVANHFSFAINVEGTQFLMKPNQMHFARIKASDLIVVDANDPETLTGPNAPDATAWWAAPTLSACALFDACAFGLRHCAGLVGRQPSAAGRPELRHLL